MKIGEFQKPSFLCLPPTKRRILVAIPNVNIVKPNQKKCTENLKVLYKLRRSRAEKKTATK